MAAAGRFLASPTLNALRWQSASRGLRRHFSNRPPLNSHFQPRAIDAKWQKKWSESGTARGSAGKPSKYVLAMFPYPSGELHMGHVRVYTITDVLARWYRLQGEEVIHPMGWDSFGLPAENAALQRGVHPEAWTVENVARMKAQLQSLGLSLDWDREFMTSDPSYYRWTQWIFLQLHQRGLVEQRSAFVNWDPVDKTVLANEQVDSQGRSWRSGALVERRALKQWFINVRDSAPELLEGLGSLDKWPESVKSMQKNWIGQSRGHVIDFQFDGNLPIDLEPVTVFTTRLETLLGVSYVALSPGHSLLQKLIPLLPEPFRAEVEAYCAKVATVKTRHATDQPKTTSGVATGLFVVHPITKTAVPVYVADYVLESAGTGAVMGVPAHDERDAQFAAARDLPVIPVLQDPDAPETPQFGSNPSLRIVNSGELDGLSVKEARHRLEKMLHEAEAGSKHTSYRLQDWLVSRQRFWGTPVPIIHCESCGPVPVPEEQLPVELPRIDNIFKSGSSEPVLASDHPKVVEWRSVECPSCGSAAQRDVDTLDTFVCSSWYFLRYLTPQYTKGPVDPEFSQACMPVDVYVGGIEHATSHLLYARFMNRFLHTHLGLSPVAEPFSELLSQGMVQSATYRHPVTGSCIPAERIRTETSPEGTEMFFDTEDPDNHPLSVSYEKMSKSKFNGVHPQDVLDIYGADTTRLFTIFAAPPSQPLQWDPRAINGVSRWLQRVWSLLHSHVTVGMQKRESSSTLEPDLSEKRLWSAFAETVAKVSEHLESRDLNLVVSDLMTFTNRVSDLLRTNPELNHSWSMQAVLRQFLVTLAPFAPHVTEELWAGLRTSFQSSRLTGWKPRQMGETFPQGDVHEQAWPEADPSLILVESIPVVLQVNGSLRGQVKADPVCLESDEALLDVVKKSELYQNTVSRRLSQGAEIKRIVCVRQPKHKKGLVNLVIQE